MKTVKQLVHKDYTLVIPKDNRVEKLLLGIG